MKPLAFASFFIILLTAYCVVGQQTDRRLRPASGTTTPCSVTIDKVPLIRGLRLGQPYNALQKALPQRQARDLDSDELGVKREDLIPFALEDPALLSGIQLMRLTYLEDSLVDIRITYDLSVSWQSNLHFVAAVAEQLNLPREGWLDRDPASLICQGCVIQVSGARAMPELHLWDLNFPLELKKREANVEERKRARFKP